jgi:hypothetical protein
MESIAGLVPTGRKLLGPASDLVEAEDDTGLRHTCIVYHEEYRQHAALTDALSVVRGFLAAPLVTGLVELVAHDPVAGAFVYPTGSVWSLAEVCRVLSDEGKVGGIRAGLELMYTAGQILVEGAEAGAKQGVYSHGGLTPRRIVFKQDGQVMVIGHALPQVDILRFHEVGGQLPREDSFRYCPPERMEARAEDLSSDLFGLALAGFELITGKPVYDGLVNDIRQQAARGEGSRRLFRFREVLPDPVREFFGRALKPEPASRYGCGEDFLETIHGLLSRGKSPGRPLIELMGEIGQQRRRVGQQMEAGATVMVAQEALVASLAQKVPTVESSGTSKGRAWTPGRRRSVRRGKAGGGLEQLLRASRIQSPVLDEAAEIPKPKPIEDEAPVLEVSEPLASELQSDGGSSRWSKVNRSTNRRSPPGSREDALVESSLQASTSDRHVLPAPPLVPPIEDPPMEPESSKPSPAVVLDSGDAGDLLARIRGNTRSDSKASPEPEVPAPKKTEQPIEPASPPDHAREAATVMMTRQELRTAVAEEEIVSTASTETPSATERDSPKDTFLVMVPGTSEPAEVVLSGHHASEEALGLLMGHLVPVPMDAVGRLSGWYRFEQDGTPVASDARVSSLDSAKVLSLCLVPNKTIEVQIEVVRGGSTVRFGSDLGVAVPISSLVGHLTDWLGLGKGTWALCFGEHRFRTHQILADENLSDGAVLQLQRVPDAKTSPKGRP